MRFLPANKTYIIAEVGVNHNANYDLAIKLIEAAVACGADAIKFQTAIPELVATRTANKADYQEKTTETNESQLDMIRKIHFPLEVYPKLKEECEKRLITFFATAFDMKSLEFLNTLGQEIHKVPSGEITNIPYLRAIGSYGKPIFLSTGMSSLSDIECALEILECSGANRQDINIMHCTTEYPAPLKEINLNALKTISSAFKVSVGYSDHTDSLIAPIGAVALGASAIEKHLTLDSNLDGPDHKASLEPTQFKEMVESIRALEVALGDGVKRPCQTELKNLPIVRRSLVASRSIEKGELYTADNLIVKRPGTGISPIFWDELIGRKAPRSFAADELVEW